MIKTNEHFNLQMIIESLIFFGKIFLSCRLEPAIPKFGTRTALSHIVSRFGSKLSAAVPHSETGTASAVSWLEPSVLIPMITST